MANSMGPTEEQQKIIDAAETSLLLRGQEVERLILLLKRIEKFSGKKL